MSVQQQLWCTISLAVLECSMMIVSLVLICWLWILSIISSISPTTVLSMFALLRADVYWKIISFCLAQFSPSLQSTVLRYFKSILLPSTMNTANSLDLSLTCLYHFSRFQNDSLLVISQTRTTPTAFLQNMLDRDSYLSSPTVSQHWMVIIDSLPFITASQSLVAYQIPIVLDGRRLNSFLVNLPMMLDFPTQESPTKINLSLQSGFPQIIVCRSSIPQFYQSKQQNYF